ncbi:TetR/AcrR family transcriptional regulator [Paramicrobacterium fandaimingii]|uniref:TetR/AcrR family transcriptional regulator n=1 Tax=Paramicrobacterium fandaimingii TaxID=2708079 RepID=UPI001AB02972
MPAAGSRIKSDERSHDVLAAAIECFARKSFYGTTTHEIADAAGTSQPYLYRLYTNKGTLFASAVDRLSVVMAESLITQAQVTSEPRPRRDAARDAYSTLIADKTILRFLM